MGGCEGEGCGGRRQAASEDEEGGRESVVDWLVRQLRQHVNRAVRMFCTGERGRGSERATAQNTRLLLHFQKFISYFRNQCIIHLLHHLFFSSIIHHIEVLCVVRVDLKLSCSSINCSDI